MEAVRTFFVFLGLGCLSFGGPAVHIGYFQKKFVQQLGWLSQERFSHLVALCQFLPGPSSSQLGFAIGYQRAGIFGASAAFLGFTLPSFLLMLIFALWGSHFLDDYILQCIFTGLKLFAVVIVADALLVMSKSFCQDKVTQGVAIFSAAAIWIIPSFYTQIAVILVGAIVANSLIPKTIDQPSKIDRLSINWGYLITFLILLLMLPVLSLSNGWIELANQFYQAGSWVFGGGHVVLPLLQKLVPNISSDTFIAGYALAQSVPGPMFTLATFLGAESGTPNDFVAAVVATLAIFLPGFLLLLAFQNGWLKLASHPTVGLSVKGINAAVVGLLASALYNPVFTNAVVSMEAMAAVLVGLYFLRVIKVPVLVLIICFALGGFTL